MTRAIGFFASVALALGIALGGCKVRNARDERARVRQDATGMSDADLRKKLTPEQYRVCIENGTEPAFRNAYWDNHAAGLYVDVISGEPLFASVHKFDSGTGWPSFFQPLDKESIVENDDSTHGMERTEVRSKKSDAHLGHVFPDGPKPSGLRYCINSASLRFVPADRLKEEGYERYQALFTPQ